MGVLLNLAAVVIGVVSSSGAIRVVSEVVVVVGIVDRALLGFVGIVDLALLGLGGVVGV